jgi:hypothetical protein
MSSSSVRIFALLHKRAKKKVVSMPPNNIFHQSQFPEIPLLATNSVTARGVSAANVVATMEIPAIYHGRFLPPRKKSERLLLARARNFNPTSRDTSRKTAMIAQSIKWSCMGFFTRQKYHFGASY